jgi:hypothetical protein
MEPANAAPHARTVQIDGSGADIVGRLELTGRHRMREADPRTAGIIDQRNRGRYRMGAVGVDRGIMADVMLRQAGHSSGRPMTATRRHSSSRRQRG